MYPVCLAVVLYTVHVILGVGRYISCVSGCCAVYSTCHFRRGEVYILCVWLLCCIQYMSF